MDIKLLENCYNNGFGFDLRGLHNKLSEKSSFHTIGNKFLSLNDLQHKDYSFNDGKSNSFKLISYNNKNYLLGDNSCYPCSIVYQNVFGYRWVNVLIVPDGKEYLIANDNKEVVFNFLTLLPFFSEIDSKVDLKAFLLEYEKSFKSNSWFSKEHLIQIVKRSKLSTKDIYDLLYELKLLNPFQLAISSLIFNQQITNQDLFYSLLVNNDIYLGISYVLSPSFKIKFSSSSNKLINSEVFKEFILTLNQEEINAFFEIDYLAENLIFDFDQIELFEDLLSIRDVSRWQDTNPREPITDYKIKKLAKLNITIDLIKEYYDRLKLNLRNFENLIRKSKGLNQVGSLYNESLLFRKISDALPNYSIISQYSPKWLGRQRFDIFIKELNIAVEYNGRQHYEPIDFYGGIEGFEYTLKRDKEKRIKCKLNNVVLIEIKYDEDLNEAVNKIINQTFNL